MGTIGCLRNRIGWRLLGIMIHLRWRHSIFLFGHTFAICHDWGRILLGIMIHLR